MEQGRPRAAFLKNKNMKHSKIILVALAFAGSVLTSCKKDDVSAPSITLYGDKTITLELHQPYTEAGATADDSKDGNLTSQIVTSGAPDVNNAGIYTINYSVSDKAGNSGENSRTVIVKHSPSTIAGTYAVKDSCGNSSTSYVEIVTVNGDAKLKVTRFANYDNAVVYFNISGETNSSIDVPEQTTILSGTPPANRIFKGSGSIASNGKKFTITYTETTNNTVTTCTGVYTKP